MRPLKVFVVTPLLDDSEGGVQVHVRETAARVAQAGIDVEVLAGDPTHRRGPAARIEGVTVRRTRTWPRGADYGFAPALPRGVWTSVADVMHVQGVHTLVAPMAMAAATLRRIPYVVTFHSGGHSQGWRNRIRSVQWRVVAPLLRRAAALVAVSEFEQRQFARVLNLPTARIKVIPNGSLTSSAPARPARDGPFHVVTVGRLEEYKGHQHVIAAWPAIAQRWPGSKLSVIGRGPYEQELRGLATEVGAGSIEFRHFPLDQRQGYLDELRTADVLVLLSEYESQGIVVLEALSSGASVVVHDATALAEYVQRGWAVGVGNVGSADEIVAAMGKALGDRRSAISLPTWDGCASALIETYRSVPRAM